MPPLRGIALRRSFALSLSSLVPEPLEKFPIFTSSLRSQYTVLVGVYFLVGPKKTTRNLGIQGS